MSETVFKVALMLAYGPLVLMAVLYLAALGMRLLGDGDLLQMLVKRTSIPERVRRAAHEEQDLPVD